MTPNRKVENNHEIEQKLRELKQDYLAALPEELEKLQRLFASTHRAPNAECMEDMRRLAHRIKGTSATYGFPTVARCADELEQSLAIALQNQAFPPDLFTQKLDLLRTEIEKTQIESGRVDHPTAVGFEGHLLIVDDDPDFLRWMSAMLSDQGFQITTSNDPLNVLNLIDNAQPELLLIDVEMPGMDGYQLCELLKANARARELPVIFITAHNSQDHRIGAFRAGADDFINKPIVLEELLARVKVRMARARLLRERQKILEHLQNQHESLLSILNQLQIGTVMIDANGKILFMNQTCARLGGVRSDRVNGRSWHHAFPFDGTARQEIERRLQGGRERLSRLSASWHHDGQPCYVECEIREVPAKPGVHLLYLYDQSEIVRLKQQIGQNRFHNMIGKSEAMRQMYGLIDQVARGDWTVLIEGETGTGKELVAQSIHAASPRKNRPFVAVNSAGLSDTLLSSQLFGHRRGAFTGAVSDQEGFFEAASGGTLFLDEIGDIPLTMQAAMLRVLQEKEITRLGESRSRKIDVRIVAATHKDLIKEVEAGRFREDLFYRLRVARIGVPPLRERKMDIPMLAMAFISESCRTADIPSKIFEHEAMNLLQRYDWPGNVRELKATIDYALIRSQGETVTSPDLPPELIRWQEHKTTGITDIDSNEETEKIMFDRNPSTGKNNADRILAALDQAGGNRTLAAKILGISRATFYRHLKDLDISLRQ